MSNIKQDVKSKYSDIANQGLTLSNGSCCGTSGCCGDLEFSMIGDEYNGVEGHVPDADLGLGCGIPTQYANIKPGDSVLDLGCGAGNDCFVARSIVGNEGKVTGLDFTEAMVLKARENNQKIGYTNVEFVQGDIEDMPLPAAAFDVLVSNCVLNLVPDKQKAFAEIYRVLKPGAHFCISDVVTQGELPASLKKDVEMYVGCVSGALDMEEYMSIIINQGFKGITVYKKKTIEVPRNVLSRLLDKEHIEQMKKEGTGIFSITVSAFK